MSKIELGLDKYEVRNWSDRLAVHNGHRTSS